MKKSGPLMGCPLMMFMAMGGVGGPAGPLTVIVSRGFAARAGCFACKTFLTRVSGRAEIYIPTNERVQNLAKVLIALLRKALTAPS